MGFPVLVRDDGTVSVRLGAELNPGLDGVLVSARLRWSVADPFAVAVTFLCSRGYRRDGDVTWMLARELLFDGLRAEVGAGDVRVRPDCDGPTCGVVVGLSSPSGRAEFLFDAVQVSVFLETTFDVVALGQESRVVDLDAELARLLDDPDSFGEVA